MAATAALLYFTTGIYHFYNVVYGSFFSSYFYAFIFAKNANLGKYN